MLYHSSSGLPALTPCCTIHPQSSCVHVLSALGNFNSLWYSCSTSLHGTPSSSHLTTRASWGYNITGTARIASKRCSHVASHIMTTFMTMTPILIPVAVITQGLPVVLILCDYSNHLKSKFKRLYKVLNN